MIGAKRAENRRSVRRTESGTRSELPPLRPMQIVISVDNGISRRRELSFRPRMSDPCYRLLNVGGYVRSDVDDPTQPGSRSITTQPSTE